MCKGLGWTVSLPQVIQEMLSTANLPFLEPVHISTKSGAHMLPKPPQITLQKTADICSLSFPFYTSPPAHLDVLENKQL